MSAPAAAASGRTNSTPGAGSKRVLSVAITVDTAMVVAKFFVAALTGSSAMLTEGVRSLVDIGNQLLLFGIRRGQRAVDEQHPFADPFTDPSTDQGDAR